MRGLRPPPPLPSRKLRHREIPRLLLPPSSLLFNPSRLPSLCGGSRVNPPEAFVRGSINTTRKFLVDGAVSFTDFYAVRLFFGFSFDYFAAVDIPAYSHRGVIVAEKG